MVQVKLPSEKLMRPARPLRALAIAAAIVLATGGATVLAAAALAPAPPSKSVAAVRLIGAEGKPTTPQMQHKLLLTDHVEKTEVPPPPPPAPENFYNNPGPVQCPSGTVAGQVDGYGNESNCQATNNGQPCVEYNASNQCVAWYKP